MKITLNLVKFVNPIIIATMPIKTPINGIKLKAPKMIKPIGAFLSISVTTF